MTSLWRHLANLHKFLYSSEKTIRSYLSMPNLKSISFKMAVLQRGQAESPSPCVCYPKDPIWKKVKYKILGYVGPLGEKTLLFVALGIAEILRFFELSIYTEVVLVKTFLQHCFYCKY